MNRKTKTGSVISADELPRVIVAPGLLDQPYTVIREDDDTDASYESRCELVALLVAAARTS